MKVKGDSSHCKTDNACLPGLIVPVLVLALVPGLSWSDSPTHIRVDASTRYQTIDGWGVYPRYWEDDKINNRFDLSFEPYVEEVSRSLANEVGINAVRVEIWSGLENPNDYWINHYNGQASYQQYAPVRYEKINDNADPGLVNPAGFQFSKFDHRMEKMVLPLKRAVEANGEKLHVNVCYVDFRWNEETRQGSLSHAENPEEFAEFVLVFFERLRDKYDILPDSFEVILEPGNTAHWRAPEIARALLAASRRLERQGFTPEIVAPSNAGMVNAIRYFDGMIKVPGVLKRLDTFAYHRYGEQRTEYVEAISERAGRHGLKTAMLERIGAGIDVLLEDLTVGNVSAWQRWASAGRTGKDGSGQFYVMVNVGAPAGERVHLSEGSHQLAQVFKYVRRGAVRIGVDSDDPGTNSVAFVNPDGSWVVVIRSRRGGGPVSLTGLPAGRYGLHYTASDQKLVNLTSLSVTTGQPLDASLPASGVLTVYSLPIE